ncbi:NAD-dependent epimerase/dehydratase family protein [Vibrio tasmaniensis]|uniref:NAD-dependent epimerase/dehydratase family protein n=1 Tax=Vibrio tasmaniensis TaxID=212663 RepID=UPI00108087E5|nr:NAD-dependent epimerase/dehydratase family protein [Vibrio tasmaniensis]
MEILVTGSSGFIGYHLVKQLLKRHSVTILGSTNKFGEQVTHIDSRIEDISPECSSFLNIDVVIHCAGIANSGDDLTRYHHINTVSTLNLAKNSEESNVKRFIFLSSLKVNGEQTIQNNPITCLSEYAPKDAYASSKAEAEKQLLALRGGMDIVIIRPPLVYGEGVKGNFSHLMALIHKSVPLPFARVTGNKRSLVSIINLLSLIEVCIEHPNATNQVFLVSDDRDISTSEMINRIALGLGKSTWQFPFPLFCYRLIGRIMGKKELIERVVGSLQVDISHTKKTLDWTPPQTLQSGFKQAANAFLESKKNGKNL